jgi:hypothetical protein
MDWKSIVVERSHTSGVLLVDQLAKEFNISEHVVRKALVRQQQSGLVEHLGRKVFLNRLARDFSERDAFHLFRDNAYVSLQTVLRDSGISTQVPVSLTCVTTEREGEFRSKSFAVTFKHISPKLYWGFLEKRTLHGSYKVAEPEKAILDWIYLARQNSQPAETDEFDISQIDRGKLLDYSQKYPKPVQQQIKDLLADFAAGRSGSPT